MIMIAPSRARFAILPLNTIADLAKKCSRAEIAVFLALAVHADDTGHCWPGRRKLAEITSLNETRVSKAISGLERKGFVKKFFTPEHRTQQYVINRSQGAVLDTSPGAVSDTQTDPAEQSKNQESIAPAEVVAQVEPPPLSQSLRKVKTGAPDTIPDTWIDQARIMRPDLPLAIIKLTGDKFLDHARANDIWLVDWQAAFRNWIRRERAPKGTPGEVNRYAPVAVPVIDESARKAEAAAYGEKLKALIIERGLALPAAPPRDHRAETIARARTAALIDAIAAGQCGLAEARAALSG